MQRRSNECQSTTRVHWMWDCSEWELCDHLVKQESKAISLICSLESQSVERREGEEPSDQEDGPRDVEDNVWEGREEIVDCREHWRGMLQCLVERPVSDQLHCDDDVHRDSVSPQETSAHHLGDSAREVFAVGQCVPDGWGSKDRQC